MKMIKYVLLAIVLLNLYAFSGCSSLENDFGSVAGAVFYSDFTTRIAGATIRVTSEDGATVIVPEMPVDSEARFSLALPAGVYVITAAPTPGADFLGDGTAITVCHHQTVRYFLALPIQAPVLPEEEDI